MKTKTQLRKEREREARRDSILDAAGLIFARKGYHEATLEEIADTAELAKGTLYNYYKDKQDIFISLARRSLQEFKDDLKQICHSAPSLDDFVRTMLELIIVNMLKHGYLLRTMLQGGADLADAVRPEVMGTCQDDQNSIEQQISETLQRFDAMRGSTAESRTAAAIIILGTARHLALTVMHEQRKEPGEAEMARIVSMLVGALTTESA